MATEKWSAWSAITGANVDVANDYLPIIDASVADALKNKTITVDELRKALVFPSFKAHKNGTDQTGVADNTLVQVTFGTEVYDIGNFFASNAWTPPAGKVSLTASVIMSGTISIGALGIIVLQKDGSDLQQANFAMPSGGGTVHATVEDVCTGSNAYTVKASMDVSSGTVTFLGLVRCTYFCGHWFSA